MRNIRSILLLILFLFISCQWSLEKVDFERETNYRHITLIAGDSLDIELGGYDLLIEDPGDESIIEVRELDHSTIRIIGNAIGETQLTISYSLFLLEGPKEDAEAITYLDISVSHGIPLEVYLGEWVSIELKDMLSPVQLLAIDSISTQILDDPDNGELLVQISDSSLALYSKDPGFILLQVNAFDSLSNLVSQLKYEVNTIIRTRVLAEIFTNAGCINCPVANHNLDLLYEDFSGQFSSIRYHVFWTDPKEPMNLYNPTEVEDRRLFYGNSYEAPRLFMNGNFVQNYENYGGLSTTVSQIIDAGSALHIWEPSHTETSDSITLDLLIENFGTPLTDLICWSVLTQDSIFYAGTNGETIHMQVMRDMVSTNIPNLGGELILQHKLKRVSSVTNYKGLHIVTMLQDSHSKAILQVSDHAITEPLFD